MSDVCTAKTPFSSLAMSDLAIPISFILSHPLYFTYFIFFSPYLLKLVCFLSPLFFTTVLLSVAFLTSKEFAVRSPVSLCLSEGSFSALLDLLGWPKKGCDEVHVEAQLYEVFFGCNYVIEVENNHVPVHDEPSKPSPDENSCDDLSGGDGEVEEKTVLDPTLESACRSSNFLKILDGFEKMACGVEEKKKFKPTNSVKIDKVVVGKVKLSSMSTDGSEAKASDKPLGIVQRTNSVEEDDLSAAASSRQASLRRNDVVSPNAGSSRTVDYYSNLGTYGSMRREKEWKRTLACKLFEERHNVGGGEGMDSLWEAYEVNCDRQKVKKQEKSSRSKEMEKTKPKKMKKGGIMECAEEDEEEMSGAGAGGQLCCLQAALKLSAGKVNLGMGKPNLVKISKAIKGFGWLHHASKHSKKVHNI